MHKDSDEKRFDEFGPEIIMEVYDPKTGMHGITVVDNTALGPGKGGIRMTPTVSREEVFRLARTMTWKCAIAQIPFGGGKSGIIANAKELKPEEKEEIVKAFSKALRPICPKHYVAAPDISTGEKEMQWFAEANGDIKSTTGKPADMCESEGKMCGIPHELGTTGFGVFQAVKVGAAHLGIDLKGLTFAVEGFGNVGSFVSKFLVEQGAVLVGVSDSKGAIYNKNGIDYDKVFAVKREKRSVVFYEDAEQIAPEKLFELEVDCIIPAARPDVITWDNVEKIKAKMVVQGSNLPVSMAVEEELHKKNILSIPDFVANAGGVISSYVEYAGLPKEDAFSLIEEKITKNTELMLDQAKKKNLSPREAALEIAKERVREAMKKRREWKEKKDD